MNLFNMLEAEEVDLLGFKAAIRDFFAGIIKSLYKLFSWSIDTMYQLARFDFGMDGFVDAVAKKVFGVLIIFMLFRLTLSFLSYIVDPESAFDGKKGVQNIVVKVLLAVVILVFIDPVFEVSKEVEKDILDSGVIESLVATNEGSDIIKIDDNVYAYGVRMSPLCNEGTYVYTFSKGDHMALLLLRPFIQPYSSLELSNNDKFVAQNNAINNGGFVIESEGIFGLKAEAYIYCGTGVDGTEITYIDGANNKEALKEAIAGPNSAEEFMHHGLYNMVNSEDDDTFMFDFNYIFATIAGFVAFLITISFCFDVVIRSLTILFLKLIAPIPVISSISPKNSDNLSKWAKKMGATWASLFIRIIVLNFAILLITAVCNDLDSKNMEDVTLTMEIFLILGILMFAKKLPSLIEEVIPGLKLSGLELNPLKRVKKDALGGEAIANAAGRTLGMVTGGIGGAKSGAKAGEEVGNKKLGRFLGALSGANAGFQNKKWSLGKGANEAYKNLTGSEFRRFSLATSLLNSVGESKIAETKEYKKRGGEKLNNLRTRLNISENRTSTLAQILANKGYDYNNLDKLMTISSNLDSRMSGILTRAGASSIQDFEENKFNKSQAEYQNAQAVYNERVNKVEKYKAEKAAEEKEINNQINDLQEKLKNVRIPAQADGIRAEIAQLKDSLVNPTGDLKKLDDALKDTINKMNDAKKLLDTSQKTYNDNLQVLNNLKATENEKNTIDTYVSNRKNEVDLRNQILDLEKELETVNKEKAESEQFYRIGPAPQKSYASAKENIDNKYN